MNELQNRLFGFDINITDSQRHYCLQLGHIRQRLIGSLKVQSITLKQHTQKTIKARTEVIWH